MDIGERLHRVIRPYIGIYYLIFLTVYLPIILSKEWNEFSSLTRIYIIILIGFPSFLVGIDLFQKRDVLKDFLEKKYLWIKIRIFKSGQRPKMDEIEKYVRREVYKSVKNMDSSDCWGFLFSGVSSKYPRKEKFDAVFHEIIKRKNYDVFLTQRQKYEIKIDAIFNALYEFNKDK